MKASELKIKVFNEWQKSGMSHPYTCCSFEGCNRLEHNDGVLIGTPDNLVCPCGKYTQEWPDIVLWGELFPGIKRKMLDMIDKEFGFIEGMEIETKFDFFKGLYFITIEIKEKFLSYPILHTNFITPSYLGPNGPEPFESFIERVKDDLKDIL